MDDAVRPVKDWQAEPVMAKIPGMPVQTPGNWGRPREKGQLKGADDKPGRAGQMAVVRVTMAAKSTNETSQRIGVKGTDL